MVNGIIDLKKKTIIPDILDFEPYYEMKKIWQTGHPFQWFTLEERAEFSKEYIPKEEAWLQLKPSNAYAIANYDIARCTCRTI